MTMLRETLSVVVLFVCCIGLLQVGVDGLKISQSQMVSAILNLHCEL